MDNWNSDTWPIQFLESEQAFFLDSTLKEHAEGILTFCIRELLAYNPHFPDNVTSSQFKAVLTEKLPKLNLPLPIIQKTPELLNDFFAFIGMSGIYPPAQYWTSFIETEGDEFRRRFRIDGSFKGETQKRSDAKINRNEPCPCGSGKKYKKCCGK